MCSSLYLQQSNAKSGPWVCGALSNLQNMPSLEISIYERAADSGRAAVICSPASFAEILTGAAGGEKVRGQRERRAELQRPPQPMLHMWLN